MALSSDAVINLMAQGYKQSEIAEEYGVSRQYVHKLAKLGGHEPVSTPVTESFPWEVDQEYFDNTIYQALRLVGHWRMDPDGISVHSMKKIKAFLRKLDTFNQVVDYSPDYPAIPGFTNTPGFAYLPRTPEDGNYMMKQRDGVKLTKLGQKLWLMPEVLP